MKSDAKPNTFDLLFTNKYSISKIHHSRNPFTSIVCVQRNLRSYFSSPHGAQLFRSIVQKMDVPGIY
jgi:hypothetical protein